MKENCDLNMVRGVILSAAALLMIGCSRVPSGVIPPGDMAELLADIHEGEGVVESERQTFATDSMRRLLRESIYRKHDVTAEQVDSSMMWYGKNIEKYMEVYDEVIEILDKRLADANSNTSRPAQSGGGYQSVSLEGDSIDVWTQLHYRRFYDLGGNNFITYRMNKDRNWQTGDSYTLNFKAVNTHRPVDVGILVGYVDGTTDYSHRQFSQKGWNDLKMTVSPDKEASTMTVVISYEPRKKEVAYIDSISLIRRHSRNTVKRPVEVDNDSVKDKKGNTND